MVSVTQVDEDYYGFRHMYNTLNVPGPIALGLICHFQVCFNKGMVGYVKSIEDPGEQCLKKSSELDLYCF